MSKRRKNRSTITLTGDKNAPAYKSVVSGTDVAKKMEQERADAVKQIAGALKQVLAVNPQMLYEASKRVYSDLCALDLENAAQVEPNPTLSRRIPIKQAICLIVGKVLMSSGEVVLSDQDIQNISLAMAKELPVDSKSTGPIN